MHLCCSTMRCWRKNWEDDRSGDFFRRPFRRLFRKSFPKNGQKKRCYDKQKKENWGRRDATIFSGDSSGEIGRKKTVKLVRKKKLKSGEGELEVVPSSTYNFCTCDRAKQKKNGEKKRHFLNSYRNRNPNAPFSFSFHASHLVGPAVSFLGDPLCRRYLTRYIHPPYP